MITLISNQKKVPVDTAWLTSLVTHILDELNYQDYDIGIMLTSNEDMQNYNETYRNKTGPTDILSFSYHQLTPGQRIEPLTEEDKNLGDLILAPEYIKSYTNKEGISFEHRIMILIVHSICHLLGYDHEQDEEYNVMQAEEERLLRSIPDSLRR
jgi:probable rRNA maturation factor